MSKEWSALEIAREYFPDKSDDELFSIAIAYTGYPAFWHGDPETCYRAQLQEFKDDPQGVIARQEAAYASLPKPEKKA